MIYTARKTVPGDIAQLDIHEWDTYGKTVQPYYDTRLNDVCSETLLADDTPFAIICAWEVAPGTMELAMFSDKSIRKHARAFFHLAEELMQTYEANGVRRWQTYVQEHNHVSADMNERLGFTIDGLLEAYYPDGSAYLFSRVRGSNGRMA